jgi:large subunit ribosomal protein L3
LKNILGMKKGMTRIFADDGSVQPVSVIEAGPCVITQVKTDQLNGYQAVQLGYQEAKKLNKPQTGHLRNTSLVRHLREFRIDDLGDLQLGQRIQVDTFQVGDLVDITGISRGKGFAGSVKRHHFSGGPKTHGQSDRWRAPGSVGAGTTPGRVFKGTKMAGHMGNRRSTVTNLRVVHVDAERNLLLVKGAVPGGSNSILIIKQSRKRI